MKLQIGVSSDISIFFFRNVSRAMQPKLEKAEDETGYRYAAVVTSAEILFKLRFVVMHGPLSIFCTTAQAA